MMSPGAIPRPTTPRIPPVEISELTGEQRRLTLGATAVIQTLAHRDELLRAWITFSGNVLSDSPLCGRERELVILRVALRTGCPYEWGNHAVAAQMYGLSPDEVRAVADESATWSDADSALLAAADELCTDTAISERTWHSLRTTLDDGAILSLIMVIGFYRMTAGLLNGVGVQPEEGRPPLGQAFDATASAPVHRQPGALSADGPVRVAGTWAVTFRHPAGDQQLTLELTDHDHTLTGTIRNPAVGVDVALEDGTIDGAHITGTTRITTPFAMTLTWDGTILGNSISGKIAISGAGSYPFDGTRTG